MRSLGRPSRRVVAASSFLLVTLLAWHVEAIAGQLTLTWLDRSTDELGFSIERSTGATGTFGEIGTTGPNVTAYTDRTVATGTTYCYRVRAFNATAYSDYSNAACATVAQTFGLAVVKIGTGSGTVTSVPAGISCGAGCSGSYAGGTAVTLTATPATGSIFTGWGGGGCSGTGPCTVTATTTVTGTFTLQSAELPFNGTLLLNKTTFSNGDQLIVAANVHVNFVFSNPLDAYLDLLDPFGFIHPVRSYINVYVPSVDFSVLAVDGRLGGLPAGTYTLSLVGVTAGGDPKNPADRLSNVASISFIVSNPLRVQ